MNKIKLSLATLAILAAIGCATIAVLPGCTTPQQTITYKTLYSLEVGTTAAFDSYCGLVIRGALPTNDLPTVSKSFNQFQSAFLLALDANQFNTNALAPASLVVESADLINLINTIKTKGPIK